MSIVRITLPAEKRALREKMRALGLGYREIAAEFARRYRLRPRAAWREAHGWSLREAAAQINACAGTVGSSSGHPCTPAIAGYSMAQRGCMADIGWDR